MMTGPEAAATRYLLLQSLRRKRNHCWACAVFNFALVAWVLLTPTNTALLYIGCVICGLSCALAAFIGCKWHSLARRVERREPF